jgi:protein SCO1/2
MLLRQSQLSLLAILFAFVAVIFLLNISSCAAQEADSNPAAPRVFQAQGVVKELPSDGKTVVIRHQAISNYMAAMTMPFDVKDTNELRGLQPGDAIHFTLVVTDTNGWVEHISKVGSAPPVEQPSRSSFRLMRAATELKLGEALPDYQFTNELGQKVSTKQFLGQAIAFTFFFTRCPYPAFCPLMSRDFEATQKKLLSMPNAPTNWHLLSISFDPEADTPAVLRTYAREYNYQPAHWSFVSGDLPFITTLGDQVGEYFGHDESGGVTHNLRTVVINAQGKLQKIFLGNNWTPDELAAEIVKAAAAKP